MVLPQLLGRCAGTPLRLEFCSVDYTGKRDKNLEELRRTKWQVDIM